MKKSLIIIGLLLCAIAIKFAVWPIIKLELAKREAIRKLSSAEADGFNSVPSPNILSISNSGINSPYSLVELSGCEIGLPDSEFKHNADKKVIFTNDNLTVAFFGAVDKSAYALLERELGRTNVFDLVSSAYHATVPGISDQRNMSQLRQYLVLINYKATVAPVGFEHSWIQFNRGDFGGFISGDMAKDGKVAVEIYVKEKDQFLAMLVRKRSPAVEMSDVNHIISELKVRVVGMPEPTGKPRN